MRLGRDATVEQVRAVLDEFGFVVIDGLIAPAEAAAYRERVESLLRAERETPVYVEPVTEGFTPPADTEIAFAAYWDMPAGESERLWRRIRRQQADEFDTPWPVPYADVCVSFIPIPTFFDQGRSQRIFNLINKDPAFAPLVEHPLVLGMVDAELGRDAVLLDVSINHVGPDAAGGGWHVDSPLSHMPDPFPAFTLSVQTVWMLDDFTDSNGATHVAAGSHRTLRAAPNGRDVLEGDTALTGRAGSLAIWLSQTWHRHGANLTAVPRCGMVVQYGRAWVKPFVDLRSPLTAETAAQFSPRLRYMMGCNASAPVRG